MILYRIEARWRDNGCSHASVKSRGHPDMRMAISLAKNLLADYVFEGTDGHVCVLDEKENVYWKSTPKKEES